MPLIMPTLSKRLLFPLLLLSLLCFLCGCQQSYEGAGTYVCTGVISGEYELNPLDFYHTSPVLELESDGSGNLSLDNAGGLISWRRSGDRFVLKFDGREYVGTMEDDGICVELFNSGLCLRFSPEGQGPVLLPVDGTENPWQGNWYGWWRITDASGGWEAYEEMWFDCFFQILLDGEQGSLLFWDQDSTPDSPLASMDVRLSDKGSLSVFKGGFLRSPVVPEDWKLSLDGCRYPQLLELSVPYSDEEGSFTAQLCLRPWGMLWDDVLLEEPELLPFYYESWYLPYVQAGSAMPAELLLPE